jgi:redox-sensitive bicupin YhaK (pirin superfamily)
MDPRYRDVARTQIPEIVLDGGVSVKVVAGEVSGVRGPVDGIVIEPEYIDVTVPANSEFTHPTRRGHTVFAYVYEGKGRFSGEGETEEDPSVENNTLVLFEDGDGIRAVAGEKDMRFLLISGKPLGEPVAWHGPIVMNTREELETAFDEYSDGTFIKYRP